ncbi:MAG: carbohydrate ABC transporter permease [Anaerolineae bacterium]
MRRWDWDRTLAFVLILPSILAIAVFVYGFIGFTGYVSLTRWNKLLPDFTWVGPRNYQTLFAHPRFQIDVRNTVVFTVLFLAASLAIGFFLAVLLDQRVKGENFFRSVYLFPMAISFVVTGVVWRWLLNPGSPEMGSTGVNLLLEHMGLGFLKWGWFTDPTVLYIHPETDLGVALHRVGLGFLTTDKFGVSVAMISLVVAATWQMSGYVMALYLAGLRGIPEELREAARVDGANELQIYRYVVLPLLRPITLGAVIILGHISLKIYDLVVAMTGPGIGFSTDVPAFFMWETTFHSNRFAQGASIAIILLIMVAVLIVPYLYSSTRREIAA